MSTEQNQTSQTQRVKLVVAYDGTDFSGWAPQNGQRTVHGTLTEGITQVQGSKPELVGASRTDGGAHALGQTCHFDTPTPIPVEKWPRTLNRILPPDISVITASFVKPDFHSRFSAQFRHYRYRILTRDKDPHRARFAHYYGRPLDLKTMQEAARHLQGEHDFFAFSQLTPPERNTVRNLRQIHVRQVRDEIWIDITGTAFVRGMMRRISGFLLEVGRHHRSPQDAIPLLNHRAEPVPHLPVVLPARGLTLLRVIYGRHPADHRLRYSQSDNPEDE